MISSTAIQRKKKGVFRAALALVACVGLVLAGCGEKEPPPKLRFWFDGSKSPTVGMQIVQFSDELVTPVPITLTAGSVLEFLPIVGRGKKGTAAMAVTLLSDGEEIALGEFPSHVSIPDPEASSDWKELLDNIVRVDLGKYKGRQGRFKWTPVGAAEGDMHAVGMFKVYKKSVKHPPPHILMICSDTHRADYSILGEGPELMPRLTELRREAMTYTRAFSDATWTLPSIASTFTGRFPRFHLTGRRTATEPEPPGDVKPPERAGEFWMRWAGVLRYFSTYPTTGVRLFTEDLQDEGYFTAWVAGNLFYVMPGMHEKGNDIVFDMRRLEGNRINETSSALIDNLPADRPVFLLAHYLDVHQYRLWKFNDRHKGEHPLTTDRENVLNCYRDAVRDSDRYLGELLDKWESKFGFENTIVIFYSDHGEHLRDPGYPKYEELAKEKEKTVEVMDMDIPLLDHGNSMDEVLLHVPLVIRYPDSMNLRGESDTPAALVDLYPTLLQAAGIQRPNTGLDGESLLEIHEHGSRKSPIHADYQLYGVEMSSIRDGDVKYVARMDGENEVAEEYLVNTALPFTEAGEKGQRIEDPERLKVMGGLFKDYARAAREQTAGMKSEFTPDSEKASKDLEATGYVGK